MAGVVDVVSCFLVDTGVSCCCRLIVFPGGVARGCCNLLTRCFVGVGDVVTADATTSSLLRLLFACPILVPLPPKLELLTFPCSKILRWSATLVVCVVSDVADIVGGAADVVVAVDDAGNKFVG